MDPDGIESGFFYSRYLVFAFVITSMSSYYGYYARGGALDVGKASTNAVVRSNIMILFLDLILSKLLL